MSTKNKSHLAVPKPSMKSAPDTKNQKETPSREVDVAAAIKKPSGKVNSLKNYNTEENTANVRHSAEQPRMSKNNGNDKSNGETFLGSTAAVVIPLMKKHKEPAGPESPGPGAPSKKRKTLAITPKNSVTASSDGIDVVLGDPAEGPGTMNAVSKDIKAIPKGKIRGLPKSFEEFSEQDHLIVSMRKEGKSWADIEKAWSTLTSMVPGKDVLRKRERALRAIAVDFQSGDSRKLVTIKSAVDAESAAELKKLETEKWKKIAMRMNENGSDYLPEQLEKRWATMIKDGEVNASGRYLGKVPQGPSEDEVQAEDEEASNTQK